MVFGVILLLISAFSTTLNAIPERIAYPHVIAHRGASGYIPEHSLPAYQLVGILQPMIFLNLILFRTNISKIYL